MFASFLKILKEKLMFIVVSLFVVVFLLFLSTLFISSSQFSLLKALIYIGLILFLINFGLLAIYLKMPKEEKLNFFYFFQKLLDYLSESIIIYDNNFKIVFINKAFEKFSGLSKQDLLNLVVSQQMIQNEKYEKVANVFFPFLQGQDLKIISQNPEVVEVKFLKPEETYLLISYIDIQLDKPYKLRVILDRTQDVIESHKKTEFVQLVSHNLLTPLNEIRWLLESINKQSLKDDDKNALNSALQVVKSTVVFSESILTFLRSEKGQLKLNLEDVNLTELLINIFDILKGKIEEKKLKHQIEISEGEDHLTCDKGLMFSALFALIENAVVYNKEGGTINISIDKNIKENAREIKIIDSGIGMSQEDLKNIFVKYYRGKQAKNIDVKGFGIGLYSAKGIIDLHSGKISIESKEGQGTTVTILIPLDLAWTTKITSS
ncbi:MAG: hypothetical protein KatS3mg097_340 [Candidatus Parcubacteria bacterium]|nr:MAG: hypothetical protein KatS3mg097_340 [Candidatus Parcubacteria bacterium]